MFSTSPRLRWRRRIWSDYHIRPEVQRRAVDAVATPEIGAGVREIGNQIETVVESRKVN